MWLKSIRQWEIRKCNLKEKIIEIFCFSTYSVKIASIKKNFFNVQECFKHPTIMWTPYRQKVSIYLTKQSISFEKYTKTHGILRKIVKM